jgi:uncharacterized protein (DUF1330 family)
MKAQDLAPLSLLVGIAVGALAIGGVWAARPDPPIYYISEIEVTNLNGYLKEYIPLVEASIKSFGGRTLAHGTKVATMEGEPPKSRVVIQVWDSIEKIQSWRDSSEFKQARALGQRYAKVRAFTVEGLPR